MDPSEIKTFNQIMEFAIEKEQEAADLYRDLSEESERAGVREMFLGLSKQEEGHKAKLQAMDRGAFPGKGASEIPDLKIGDYLSPVSIGPDSSYQDILIFAMKREDASVQLYKDLASHAEAGDAKQVFETLAEEEKKHKLNLETEYDEHVLKDN